MSKKRRNPSREDNARRYDERPKRKDSPLKSYLHRSGPPRAPLPKTTETVDRDVIRRARQRTRNAIQDWLRQGEEAARGWSGEDLSKPLIDRLDPWQREALDALLNGEHVIVDAPTTAGKTRVVEAFFELNLSNPLFRAAYTTPVKSLSNDKLREFIEAFGRENVGIATGDIKENLGAPIVVATLESYRNSLLGVEPDLGRSLVVFDEYHFMQDIGRGSAWEEAIILTPPRCQLLLLSASVDNAEEFAAWIEKLTQRPCRLIRTKERPVPLVDLIHYGEQWLLVDQVRENLPRKGTVPTRFPLDHDELARRLGRIPELGLTPCIVYAGRRMSCENLAMEICKVLPPLDRHEAQRIRAMLESGGEDAGRFLKPNLRRSLLVYGVGYHHSGLAPQARRAVETLVKQGHLRFCVATMGLSIGINFSVRSTVISDYIRPGELGFTSYSPSEVLQMLGRAGRRGKDVVGFSLWPSVASFHKFGGTEREPCESRLKNDPTTFLGLLGRGFRLRDIENFYEKSFLRFGDRSVSFSLIRAEVLRKALGVEELSCGPSSAHAFSLFLQDDQASPCFRCAYRDRCHAAIEEKMNNPLAHLHVHLHNIGCIDGAEQLTRFGSIARYFPQSGGLLIAFLIDRGDIDPPNLMAGLEIMGSLCLSRFKDPRPIEGFDYPFDPEEIEELLQEFYPLELFEELYDPPGQRRDSYVFREFNPLGAALVGEWARGASWSEIVMDATDEKFGQGDLMALIYRAATFLQSTVQAHVKGLSPAAASLRDDILREPLTPAPKGAEDEEEDLDPEAPKLAAEHRAPPRSEG